MSKLVIDVTQFPLDPEPRNGEKVRFLVEGVVRRTEDDLLDVSGYTADSSYEYLHGAREIEVTLTRIARP